MDPAGEFTNDEWATFLQSEGIACSVAASRSHWQIGRSEVHGKIVKTMLSHMELDRAIDTEEEFDRCLRQAFNAKNSLSRAYGFTPEQALLGKARNLPGSLTGDASVASHELVDSQTQRAFGSGKTSNAVKRRGGPSCGPFGARCFAAADLDNFSGRPVIGFSTGRRMAQRAAS